MSIFDNIEDIAEDVEVVEESTVETQAKFIKESGAYRGTLTKFWFDQNDNNTTFYNLEFTTVDGQVITDREWFITKDGRTQFAETDFKTKEKTGKMKDFSGFARLRVISRALTGDDMAWKKAESKIVPIYDFNAKTDVDKEVDVPVAFLGKEVEILVRRTLEDKTKLNPATGDYEAIAEVRGYNDIKGWLDPETHKSYAETLANKEAKSYKAFMTKIEEQPILDKREVSAGVDANAPKEEKPPSEAATNAFA